MTGFQVFKGGEEFRETFFLKLNALLDSSILQSKMASKDVPQNCVNFLKMKSSN